MSAVTELSERVGVRAACEAMQVARSTYYNTLWPAAECVAAPRRSPRALSDAQRSQVLDHLNSPRFCDQAPREVYATMLDEGTYVCSISTMYRLLRAARAVRERRDQLRHPSYRKPELLATGPNEVWSWDITKLLGPQKWSYFYLYVIIDIYSRRVVSWLVADHESSDLAKQLIEHAVSPQGVDASRLTLHADRGSSMKSKHVAQLLADLGVTKSHSRPYTSDDNPYSEAQFKTLKYQPNFPGSFGCIE
ncbi:MAG: transposase family protein, partial [Rhodocyclaceae bacterium]|nr:transposase family protein [Rhodocyclaceae bacterium]